MATLLARVLIRAGADLHAKNLVELGVLHLAVQSNNMLALKFAVTHNQQIRAKRKARNPTKGLSVEKTDLFDLNDQPVLVFALLDFDTNL